MNTHKWTARDMADIALVAAIYVVLTVTPPLNALSSGMYQFRVSEMLNFLAFYNKKYVYAVTIGCMIANTPFLNPYSLGAPDIVIGGLSTLIFVSMGVALFKKYDTQTVLANQFKQSHLFFALFFSASMFTIAAELTYFSNLPFLPTWGWLFLGEFSSLVFGAFVIHKISKHIDFTR